MLFLSVLALRLHSPFGIKIAGEFRVGGEGNRILDPALYEMTSSWNRGNSEGYTPAAIAGSALIADRLVRVSRIGLPRLQTGLILFGQVTIGFSKSLQLSYIGLFAALEALFVPTGNKAATLARRVSNFLGNFQFPEPPMDNWIKNEYITGRHKIVHGIHDATFGGKLPLSKSHVFGRLHEITRLSLLGFLSFGDQELAELTKVAGNTLQKALDRLNRASGAFLESQRMWLD